MELNFRMLHFVLLVVFLMSMVVRPAVTTIVISSYEKIDFMEPVSTEVLLDEELDRKDIAAASYLGSKLILRIKRSEKQTMLKDASTTNASALQDIDVHHSEHHHLHHEKSGIAQTDTEALQKVTSDPNPNIPNLKHKDSNPPSDTDVIVGCIIMVLIVGIGLLIGLFLNNYRKKLDAQEADEEFKLEVNNPIVP